jgi:hypothetical protein
MMCFADDAADEEAESSASSRGVEMQVTRRPAMK